MLILNNQNADTISGSLWLFGIYGNSCILSEIILIIYTFFLIKANVQFWNYNLVNVFSIKTMKIIYIK